MGLGSNEIRAVAKRAELLVPAQDLEVALDLMARDVAEQLAESNPLVLCVMTGGVVIAGRLLVRLNFPLRLDYVHASRYRDTTRGGELHWIHRPSHAIAGQDVLILDDILDEGLTLDAIVAACWEDGAKSVRSAVLLEKVRERVCPVEANFVGVRVPDRYLFGYGLDYKGYLRNAAGIYAVADVDL